MWNKKLKNLNLKIIVLFILFFCLLIIFGCADSYQIEVQSQNDILNTPKVCFNEFCFNVEVADTLELRQKGLMYKEKLGTNEGMLFVFEKPDNYPFWMKNTLIYLDIIWIDSEGKVVAIQKYAEPCTYDPCKIYDPGVNALYVLEIRGGLSVEKNIKIGDYAKIKI